MAVRNTETLETLCASLEANGGDLLKACHALGTSTGWVRQWMRDDPKVEAAIKDAKDGGLIVLESHAIKRATVGVKEPIYYKDLKVGYKRKYSDALLIKLLESRGKDVYGKSIDVNQTISLKHLSDDELNSKIDMLAERLGYPALAAPIDAEFSVVDDVISVDDLL